MKKYIKNITGKFPFELKQTLAYKEEGKGNLKEMIQKDEQIKEIYEKFYKANPDKYKDYVLIRAGETIETTTNGKNIVTEPRLKIVDEKSLKETKGE